MGGLAQIPGNSALHLKLHSTGVLQAKSANSVKTALALNAISAGQTVAPTVALVMGMLGRNLTITVTDANDSSSSAWRIWGWDQFNNYISERFPASGSQAGHGVITGKKIFAKVDKIECLANVAGAAADNITVGTGDKAGLPVLLSGDVHEVLDAELAVALAATAPSKVVVNATNFDVVYSAADFTQFGAGNVIVAGDSLRLRYRSDPLTPDDNSNYPARNTDP